MNRIIIHSQVGSDGVLQISLPLGASAAGQEVEVVVGPLKESSATGDEWQWQILETAGKWRGGFERPSQGASEEREPLA